MEMKNIYLKNISEKRNISFNNGKANVDETIANYKNLIYQMIESKSIKW